MDENTFNPIQGLFDLFGKKIDADAQAKSAQANLGAPSTVYGVDEYGRLYLRGAPTASSPAAGGGLQLSPTVILVGLGILVATIAIAKS